MSPRPGVSFVWNPNVVASADVGHAYIDAAPFYPQNKYVDWIAADGYNKISISSNNPVGFDAVFSGFYSEYTNSNLYGNKPLMIGETASCTGFVNTQYSQANYIATLEADLKSNYSSIKAVDYYDAKAAYYGNPYLCNWALEPDGITAFGHLANDPYFVQSIPGTK